MIVQIDDTMTIGDLQERFSHCYPLLRLEFCRKKHGWEKLCPDHDIIRDDVLISALRNNHNPGIIEMKTWSKVGEVEKEFYSRFGLNVQICYRSGGKWIQTGKSDNVTIKSLMQKASKELNKILL